MRRPKFGEREVEMVRAAWLERWDRVPPYGGRETATSWINAVLDVMYQTGNDVLTKELLAQEAQLAARGLADEYVDALVTATEATTDNVMTLLTANSSQRQRAVDIVLAYEAERKERGETN